MITKKKFDEIKWEGLEEQIKRVTGLKVLEIDKELDEEGRIEIGSQDLKDYAGIMSSMYKKLVIGNFGAQIDDTDNILWLPIHFLWEYKDGGTNGHKLFTSWYNFETNAWSFK